MADTETMRKAARFLREAPGLMSQKMSFLMDRKGLTYQECLEALNDASNGALIKSATGED